jgi:DNA invertase Pin-like site-specific DNA recombinase
VREGDTLIVTKLDRLARSVPDLLTMVARLEGKNVAYGYSRCPARNRSIPALLSAS